MEKDANKINGLTQFLIWI